MTAQATLFDVAAHKPPRTYLRAWCDTCRQFSGVRADGAVKCLVDQRHPIRGKLVEIDAHTADCAERLRTRMHAAAVQRRLALVRRANQARRAERAKRTLTIDETGERG